MRPGSRNIRVVELGKQLFAPEMSNPKLSIYKDWDADPSPSDLNIAISMSIDYANSNEFYELNKHLNKNLRNFKGKRFEKLKEESLCKD